jgi:hypothetical protein
LNPQYVHSPENLDHVLKRWAQLPVAEKQETSNDGYFTSLPLRDEFRCLIAALYGRGFDAKKTVSVYFGKPDADDVAIRCAYYARGQRRAKEMAAGYEKDGTVFTFAATLNANVRALGNLRKLMEEDYLNLDDQMTRRWLKYDEQVRKARPNTPPVSQELLTEIVAKPIDATRSSITELQGQLTTLTTRVAETHRGPPLRARLSRPMIFSGAWSILLNRPRCRSHHSAK